MFKASFSEPLKVLLKILFSSCFKRVLDIDSVLLKIPPQHENLALAALYFYQGIFSWDVLLVPLVLLV